MRLQYKEISIEYLITYCNKLCCKYIGLRNSLYERDGISHTVLFYTKNSVFMRYQSSLFTLNTSHGTVECFRNMTLIKNKMHLHINKNHAMFHLRFNVLFWYILGSYDCPNEIIWHTLSFNLIFQITFPLSYDNEIWLLFGVVKHICYCKTLPFKLSIYYLQFKTKSVISATCLLVQMRLCICNIELHTYSNWKNLT